MTRCSTSLIIRETQIKTATRSHLAPVTMAITQKSTNYSSWRGCREKGTLLSCWWEWKLVTATMEYIMEVSLKIKNRATI